MLPRQLHTDTRHLFSNNCDSYRARRLSLTLLLLFFENDKNWKRIQSIRYQNLVIIYYIFPLIFRADFPIPLEMLYLLLLLLVLLRSLLYHDFIEINNHRPWSLLRSKCENIKSKLMRPYSFSESEYFCIYERCLVALRILYYIHCTHVDCRVFS